MSKPRAEWFKDNQMRQNTDKCHLILSDSNVKTINADNFTIKIAKTERLLEAKFDDSKIFNPT